MGGEYFSQLHVADDRSLGEARIGQELVDEQGHAQILEKNGALCRTRTCDPRLRRPDVGFGCTKTVICERLSPVVERQNLARIREFDRLSDSSPITDPSSQHLSSVLGF